MDRLLEELKQISSERKDLKSFATVMTIAFLILGIWGLYKEGGHAVYVLLVISACFLILRFTFPNLLLPLQKVWMGFGIVMGFILAPVMICIIFYLVLSPMAILSRLMGKDMLDTKLEPERRSYWVQREPVKRNISDYEKQF